MSGRSVWVGLLMADYVLLAPWWLAAALLLLVAGLMIGSPVAQAWQRVMSAAVFRYLGFEVRHQSRNLAFLLAAGIAVALANPAQKITNQTALQYQEAWIIMLDMSPSMNLTDLKPTRLSVARRVTNHLLEASGGRAVATVVFAGDAFIAVPLSFDIRHHLNISNALDANLIPLPGSSVHKALEQAENIIQTQSLNKARLFLISDAPQLRSETIDIAARLAGNGHQLDVVSVFGGSEMVDTYPDASAQLANVGNGYSINVNSNLEIDFSAFDLNRTNFGKDLILAGFNTTGYQLLSHWWLLLLMPPFLLFAGRDR